MGELLDALNAADAGISTEAAPTDLSAGEKAAAAIQSASQTMSDAVDAGRRPGMPLETLARLTRESPLAALTIAFLFGLVISRRRYQPMVRRLH
jgi:hypothetical protein